MPLVHPSARAIPDLALRGCQAADGLAGFSEAQPALVAKNSSFPTKLKAEVMRLICPIRLSRTSRSLGSRALCMNITPSMN